MAVMLMCGNVVFTKGAVILQEGASTHQTIIAIFYALKKIDKSVPEPIQQYMDSVFAVPD